MVIGGLCGTWMRTAKADYVFYEEDTSLLHQQHIVFHELGHILRRHVPGKELSKDLARSMAPGMRVSDVFRVLGRDSYTDDDEFEAELIATLILSRIGRQAVREAPKATDPTASDIIARITNSLSRGER
jgi:SOS response regulatory protein OraA/RecX